MQFSGSPSQSVLQRNRSHESHPIGGVRASPLSKLVIPVGIRKMASTNDTITVWKMQIICRGLLLLLLLNCLPPVVIRDRAVPPLACPSVIVGISVVSASGCKIFKCTRFRSITLVWRCRRRRLLILLDHVVTQATYAKRTLPLGLCWTLKLFTTRHNHFRWRSFSSRFKRNSDSQPLSFSCFYYFCTRVAITKSCFYFLCTG